MTRFYLGQRVHVLRPSWMTGKLLRVPGIIERICRRCGAECLVRYDYLPEGPRQWVTTPALVTMEEIPQLLAENPKTYVCEGCRETFEFEPDADEEARREAVELWGRSADDPSMAIVCQDCFEKIVREPTPAWRGFVDHQRRLDFLEALARAVLGPSAVLLRELYGEWREVGVVIPESRKLVVGTEKALAVAFALARRTR